MPRTVSSDRVPTQFAVSLLRMVGERGYDVAALLAQAGLDFDPLQPDAPVGRPVTDPCELPRDGCRDIRAMAQAWRCV